MNVRNSEDEEAMMLLSEQLDFVFDFELKIL